MMFVIGLPTDLEQPPGSGQQQAVTKSLAAAATVGGTLFQGYDSVTGQARPSAVSGKSSGNTGAHTKAICKICTDLETVAKTVNISQSLSVGFGPAGNVSEKVDFVSSLNVSSYSVSIVVYAQHVTGTEEMTTVTPNAGVSEPNDHDSRKKFFLKYGDSFVSSRTLGGEYIAVYTFYSQSREEQDTLTGEMQGQGLFEVVTVDASLQVKIQNITKSTRTRSVFSQMISGIKNPSLPPSDGIMDYARKFPELPLDAPTIISFQTAGYEQVFGGFGDIPKNRVYFVGTGVVGGLTKNLIAVRHLMSQIDWLNSIYRFYGYHGDAKLAKTAADARTDLDAINAQMQAWETDPEPGAGFTVPALKTADSGTPSLNYEVHYSDRYGGTGGGSFNDVTNPSSYLQLQTRIAKIELRFGVFVDSLATTYTDRTGKQWTATRGGGGSSSSTLDLGASEFVSKVDGRSGLRVDQLKITSTKGLQIEGGSRGGSDFKPPWTAPSNSVMLGFAGRSGGNLDQIQVVYVTFSPAKWD